MARLLYTQFRPLREDLLNPIRSGLSNLLTALLQFTNNIKLYKTLKKLKDEGGRFTYNNGSNESGSLQVYINIRFTNLSCDKRKGFVCTIRFKPPRTNVTPSRKQNSRFKLDSTLIQLNHIPLFASWINGKDSSHYNNKNIPYDFKLLYHSSRDGFDAASFHRNCDNKGATIWVVKIQGPTQLIGGYNSLDWCGITFGNYFR